MTDKVKWPNAVNEQPTAVGLAHEDLPIRGAQPGQDVPLLECHWRITLVAPCDKYPSYSLAYKALADGIDIGRCQFWNAAHAHPAYVRKRCRTPRASPAGGLPHGDLIGMDELAAAAAVAAPVLVLVQPSVACRFPAFATTLRQATSFTKSGSAVFPLTLLGSGVPYACSPDVISSHAQV